jgi:adenylosuccinate lyase
MRQELGDHWEVLAEAVQTILRKEGRQDAYEKLKDMTRGEKIDQESMGNFIRSLKISNDDKDVLLGLSPESYVGEAPKIVEQI